MHIRTVAGAGAALCAALLAGAPNALAVPARAATAGTYGTPTFGVSRVVDVPGPSELNGIACPSPTVCDAVGGEGESGSEGVVVPITNGKPGKPIVDTDAFYFRDIACVSTTTCVVVGDFSYDSSSGIYAAGVWLDKNGTLTQIPVPTVERNAVYHLYGVTCPTATTCLAVGSGSYDGSGVSEVASIELAGTPSVSISIEDDAYSLAGVSCPVRGYCALAGAGGVGGELVQVDDQKAAGASEGPVYGFSSVACLGAGDCEVAGQAEGASFNFTAYVGSVVGFTLKPLVPAGGTIMFAVATLGTSDYLAVGTNEGEQIARLVSATGSLLAIATPTSGYLQGAACPSPTLCVAAGFTGSAKTLVATVEFLTIDGLHPLTAPSAPSVRVTAETRTSETVSVGAPARDGGDPVTGYHLRVRTCAPHHHGCVLTTVTTVALTATHRTVTVAHLKAGTVYYFAATATSKVGTSAYSATVHHATKPA